MDARTRLVSSPAVTSGRSPSKRPDRTRRVSCPGASAERNAGTAGRGRVTCPHHNARLTPARPNGLPYRWIGRTRPSHAKRPGLYGPGEGRVIIGTCDTGVSLVAHSLTRSQKRRVAKLRAESAGRPWRSNADQRRPVPSPGYVLPDTGALDTIETTSARRALTAGRLAFRRSQRTIVVRGIDATYQIVS